jgi:hypothetical protein
MLKSLICRVSTVVVQQFCKLLVGGSNPSPGTNFKKLETPNPPQPSKYQALRRTVKGQGQAEKQILQQIAV